MTQYRIKEMKMVGGGKKFVVSGGSSIYYLYPKLDGNIRCTCPGFRYHGRCKHQALCPIEIKRFPLKTMLHMADQVLEKIPFKTMLCGSARRGAFTCKDMDILVLVDPPGWEQIPHQMYKAFDNNWKIGKHGGELISGHYCDVPVDFTRVSTEREWPFMSLYRTGSRETNIRMRGRAKGWGMKLNERGLFNVDGSLIDCIDEREIFEALDMNYLEPSER